MKAPELSQKASITTDMFNDSLNLGLERKLELFAGTGFRYIHWCDDWNTDVIYGKKDVEQYSQLVKSFGLSCLDVHGAQTETVHIAAQDKGVFEKFIVLLRNRVEFCSAVGGDAVVVHAPSADIGPQALNWKIDRSLQVLESVRPLCEDLDIVLAVENCEPSDVGVLQYYFERYPPEFLGYCFDSGHAHLNKDFTELTKFGNRLKVLHLHDNRGREDDHQPPFWGTIDWQKVMRWIGESGYTKPVNFEISHDARFFEGPPERFLDYTASSVLKTLAFVTNRGTTRPDFSK